MRGPRERDRSGDLSVFGVVPAFEDGGCGDRELPVVAAVADGTAAGCTWAGLHLMLRTRIGRLEVRADCDSLFTSARKRPIVSMLTDTSTVASSSRISRNDAPFSRSSTMPSFIGISFA